MFHIPQIFEELSRFYQDVPKLVKNSRVGRKTSSKQRLHFIYLKLNKLSEYSLRGNIDKISLFIDCYLKTSKNGGNKANIGVRKGKHKVEHTFFN